MILRAEIAIPFRPVGEMKLSSTPGDNYGTFNERGYPYFSNKLRKPPKVLKRSGHFSIRVPKEGNSGYADITLSPYPERL